LLKNDWSNDFITKLGLIIPEHRLLINEPMSRHTTFKIGGPADFLAMPATIAEVAAILDIAKEYKVPVVTFGNGSNVLVLDKGIRGIVLKFGRDMGYIRHKDSTIIAGAGAMLASVSRYAADNKLTGMEFAVGIPGSVGGAVFMNAGAYEGEMSCVVSAVACVCENGKIRRFSNEDSKFSYRHSVFQDNGCTICEVELTLEEGEPDIIRSKMTEYINRRQTKQPVELPSAGSTFKRPPGYYAGTLIDQAGLKGLTVGGAQVSTKHAGFIVNTGGATANDVLTLIKEVQSRVHDIYGIDLQPEVRILGEG